MKNTHEGVLLLVHAKSNTPSWVFFTFLKLCNGTKALKASHKYTFFGEINKK